MPLQTLQILVEADASGLKSTLERAGTSIIGFVEKANSQGINWEKILAGTATPAILSAVAGSLALAITQSLNFQQQLATAGTAAGETSGQIAQTGSAALALSKQVTPSAQDLANAMLQVSAVFGTNTQATQDITQAMAQLANSGFGSLGDIVNTVIPLFKQFGATTEEQGIQVLTDLMHAAEAAKESIPSLTEQFASFSAQLPEADKNVAAFNGLISAFGAEIQAIGAEGAGQIFAALAASSNSAVGPIELLGISFSSIQKSLLTDGGLTAIEQASTTLAKMGPGASLVATQLGFSAEQVSQFQLNATKLPDIATNAAAIATNTQTIADAFNASASTLRAFQLAWNTFLADITSTNLADYMKGLLDFVEAIIKGFQGIVTIGEIVGNLIETVGTIIGDILTGQFSKIKTDLDVGIKTMQLISPSTSSPGTQPASPATTSTGTNNGTASAWKPGAITQNLTFNVTGSNAASTTNAIADWQHLQAQR